MQLTGTHFVAAPPRIVWAALDEPDLLQACIPGCDELTGSLHGGFRVKIARRVGLIPLKAEGRIKTRNVDTNKRATFTAGHRKADPENPAARLDLELQAKDDGTDLSYAFRADFKGPVAAIPTGVFKGFAERMTNDFFEAFTARAEEMARNETA